MKTKAIFTIGAIIGAASLLFNVFTYFVRPQAVLPIPAQNFVEGGGTVSLPLLSLGSSGMLLAVIIIVAAALMQAIRRK